MRRLEYDTGGRRHSVNTTWYRGEHTNFNPARGNLRALGAVESWILPGWVPEQPFITPETNVTAFGSCFARHIGDYLNSRNYNILTRSEDNAYVVRIGEGLVNTYAIRGQFDWAFRGVSPTTDLWHGYDAESYGYDEAVRETTRAMFDRTDVFVLTLGLSEIWYDEPTGEVFWRAVPADVVDPSRHKFRVSTVAENLENLRAIHQTIREFRPDAEIVLTLSPIPLVATFRPVSCITANSVSKAVLRAAVDELCREAADPRLHYWPSYEIVQDGFGTGKWVEDGRHVKRPVLDYIMGLFESYYCVGSAPEQTLVELQVLAMEAAGDLPAAGLEAARSDDPAALQRWVAERLESDDHETAELLLAYAEELRSQDPEVRRLRAETAARIAAEDAARRAAKLERPAKKAKAKDAPQAAQAPSGLRGLVRKVSRR